ncbi:MAG TPA: hypothetical protein DCO89_02955 [Clostridiales bacterium]|nr:hypothetical protein [Clostridiales bacterium]
MEKLKKFLMITSLCGVGIVAVMLISAVFGVNIFAGIPLRILLIIATIAVASGISINEIAVIKRKKILGYVGLGLLALSTSFAVVIFCSNILEIGGDFVKITGITAIFSIMFIMIISYYSKLGRKLLAMQIPTYICLAAIDVVLSLTIAGVAVFELPGVPHIFTILCIVVVALLISLTVISAKMKSSEPIENVKKDMIWVSAEEFKNLKEENEKLKAELEKFANEQ